MEVQMHGRGRNSEPPGDTQHLREHKAEWLPRGGRRAETRPSPCCHEPARDTFSVLASNIQSISCPELGARYLCF